MLEAQPESATNQLAMLDPRLADARTLAGTLGLDATKINKWGLNMTAIVKGATELVHREGDVSSSDVRQGTRLLWRTQSGHAHGTPASWPAVAARCQ